MTDPLRARAVLVSHARARPGIARDALHEPRPSSSSALPPSRSRRGRDQTPSPRACHPHAARRQGMDGMREQHPAGYAATRMPTSVCQCASPRVRAQWGTTGVEHRSAAKTPATKRRGGGLSRPSLTPATRVRCEGMALAVRVAASRTLIFSTSPTGIPVRL